MSIRSLADFNGGPLGGVVTGWRRHRHRPGPTLQVDTTSEGWDFYLATSGDLNLAINEDFPMAMDTM